MKAYFQALDQWTDKPQDAFDFKLIERALRFCHEVKFDLQELELVLAFEDPGLNITLPIDSRFGSYGTAIANPPREPARLLH